MKILVITTFYPQPNRQDLIQDTSVVHYFAKEWVKEGHCVDVVHLYAHNFKKILNYKHLKYGKFQKCQQLDGVNVHLMENQFFVKNARCYLKFQQRNIFNKINEYFDNNFKEYEPDIVLVHFPSHFVGIIENLKFKCKKVAICHITDYKAIKDNADIKNKLIQTYDGFGARSFNIKKQIEKNGIPIRFIANSGIDANLILSEEELKEKLNKKDDEMLKILYAGSFIKRKNVDKIIQALGNIKNQIKFEFTIIGDGRRKQKLVKIAKKNNIINNCSFLGKKSRNEVIEYMKSTDLFVMVSEKETLGLTYLEAMSQGCLVIGSRNEGIDGIIIDKKNGFLVDSNNCNELSQKIIEINLLNYNKREEIVKNAISTINKLSSEEVAKQYLLDAMALN